MRVMFRASEEAAEILAAMPDYERGPAICHALVEQYRRPRAATLSERILQMLSTARCSKSDFTGKLQRFGTAREIQRVLHDLEAAGMVKRETMASTGGRPAVVWSLR